MRWKPRNRQMPNWVAYPLVAITAPIWVVIGAWFVLLIGAAWLKSRAVGPRPEWRPWFAWYPVWVPDDDWSGGNRVWLEMVERRRFDPQLLHNTEHRLPASRRALAQEQG